jgi:hypothetical protein
MKAKFFLALFLVGLTASALISPSAKPVQAGAPPATVGVIRWDGWYSNPPNPTEHLLAPPKWQYRLPFFAQFLSNGATVTVREDAQAIIDQEIEFAHAAGINYWAFDYYVPADLDPNSAWGDSEYGLHLYLSSAYQADMSFALILLGGPALGAKEDWATKTVPRIVYLMQQPTYQRVLGSRPLLYIFNLRSFIKQFGSNANSRLAIASLRQAAAGAGLGNPYLVGMSFDPLLEAPTIKSLGLNAVSSYSAVPTQGGFRQLPYQRLALANRAFWNQELSTGLKVVPTVNTGWDPRPLMVNPAGMRRYGSTSYYTQGTPAAIAANLATALQWTSAHLKAAEANTVLVYAWNENAEGGWLTPTLAEGNSRLVAIGQVLNNRLAR